MEEIHPALSLSLFLPENRLRIEDPVWVMVSLRNQGVKALIVNGRLLLNEPFTLKTHHEISFEIIGPPSYEHASTFLINSGPAEPGDFIWLYPDEAISRTYRLTDYYSLHLLGNYRLRVQYANWTPFEMGGENAWIGQLLSEWEDFLRLP